MEHEAARNTLLQFLKEEGEIDLHQDKELAEISSALTEMKSMFALVTVMSAEDRNKKLQELIEEVRRKEGEQSAQLTADFLKSDADSDAAAERISRMELEARRDALRAKVERRREDFLERAERLTEKKLELAELEARYQLPK